MAKEQARLHFDKAVTLQEEEAWAPALAEFRESLTLFPTRAATKNAAVCLQKLERYDEALEMFQALLRDFPNLTAEDKALAERAISRLTGLVGAIQITLAEKGASVVVDGRPRGETPLQGPLQVSAGSHVIRVYKDGYLPFETSLDIAGAQTKSVEVKLAALSESGRLKISESGGKSLSVIIDNVVVGKTPWEGSLAPGAHSVSLKEGDTFGTQPVTARIKVNEVTSLNLTGEELPAWLRIEPTPADASVFLDEVEVGRGVWEGRVRKGAHKIEVVEDGFIGKAREVSVPVNGREIVLVALERDRSAARWARPARFFGEVAGAFAFAPELGGGLSDRCAQGSCSARVAAGGGGLIHVGYALSMGFEVGLSGGFVSFGAVRNEEGATLDPVGNPSPLLGSTRDVLRMNGAALGGHLGYVLGDRIPLTFRVAGGVLIGSFTDTRSGTFRDSDGNDVTTGAVAQSHDSAYGYVGPEIRAGYRVNDHLLISAGVLGVVLIGATVPTWNGRQLVNAGADGAGTYRTETLLGDALFLLMPSIGARYEL